MLIRGLSIVIPHWPKTPAHDLILRRCLNSLADGTHSHTITVVNFGLGYAKSCNYGVRAVNTSHVMFLNNDMIVETPQYLHRMTRNGNGELTREVVSFPCVNGAIGAEFCGPAICFPTDIFYDLGGFDERYEMGFWEDVDMYMKVLKAGIERHQIIEVKMTHPEPGYTMKSLTDQNYMQINRDKFIEKWGEVPIKDWV